MKLEIELIPQTTFFTNVRSIFPKHWDFLRKACYRKAKYKCEICGGKGPNHPVECHEIWEYDYKKRVQKLIRLIALCPACHEVKHMGLAKVRGRFYQALSHFMKVNQIDKEEAMTLVYEAFAEWQRKNSVNWKLDVSEIQKEIKNK